MKLKIKNYSFHMNHFIIKKNNSFDYILTSVQNTNISIYINRRILIAQQHDNKKGKQN